MTEVLPHHYSYSERRRGDYARYSGFDTPYHAAKSPSTRNPTFGPDARRSRVPSPPSSPFPSRSSSYSRRGRSRTERHREDYQSKGRNHVHRQPKRRDHHHRRYPEHDEFKRRSRGRGDGRKHHHQREQSRGRNRYQRRNNESLGSTVFATFLLGFLYLVGKSTHKDRRRQRPTRHTSYHHEPGYARTIIGDDEDTADSWEKSDRDSNSDGDDRGRSTMMSGALPVVRHLDPHSIPYQPAQPMVFPVLHVDTNQTAPYLARGEGRIGQDHECIVCGEEQTADDFVQQITSRCEHDVSTCRTCLGQWIRSSLQSRAWNEVKCAECRETCSYEDIVRIAPLDIVDAIHSQSARTVLSQIPDFHWCTSPRCGSGQIHEPDGPIMTCHDCGFRTCVYHNIPWHQGETCAEYTYRHSPRQKRREERASEKLVSQIAKMCPGPGCGAPIQKNYGCDHMTCGQCSHEFCWICLASYDRIRNRGNMAHGRSCRYHAMNV